MACENEHDRLDDAAPNEIERRLATFAPAAARVDRDRLMFLAGQAQALEVRSQKSEVRRSPGSPWLWPAAAISLGATSLALLVALAMRAEPQVVYRDVLAAQARQAESQMTPRVELDAVPITLTAARRPAMTAAAADNYVRTRDVALRMGLDALGRPRVSGIAGGGDEPAATYGGWLHSLTGSAEHDGDKSSLPLLPNM